MRGFEAAGGLVRDRIRKAGESRGFALSRLLTYWTETVGEEIAAVARPVRIGYGRDGLGATLTLLLPGAQAPLVQMQVPRIIERVNAVYGYNAISRIHLTQTAAEGFAEGRTPFAPPQPPPAPGQTVRAAATAISRDIGDEKLRAVLEALGEKVLSRPGSRKG
jgi:hypothetical protein